MKKLNVGILGFGTVGGGAYEILTKNHDLITQRTGVSIDVVKALVRRKRDGIPAHLTTEDPDDILKNPAIDVVVETMGGIEPATSFMLQAMENGKHVVTANKAAVAAALPDDFSLLGNLVGDDTIRPRLRELTFALRALRGAAE